MAEVGAKPLLIELGTEELPIGAVDSLARALAEAVHAGLAARGFASGAARHCCTPRRLAVQVQAVAARQADGETRALGPAVAVALDAEGNPTPALRGFAAKQGVDVAALTREVTDKGERYACVSRHIGQPLARLLPEILVEAVKALPIARPMRWGEHDFSFVRPLHWLVLLHGDQVIEAELFGVRSGLHSRGHRFHADKPVWISNADDYPEALRAAKVIADPGERRERIRDEVARVAAQLGGVPQLDDPLLDQIANLTEWPVAIGCTFDEAFLAVPQEALISTMVANQKFVPLINAAGRLLPRFIGVANIDSKDPAQIRHGYERVIRPRFADAKFFFDEDLKTPLAQHRSALETVTYQPALGSLWSKSVRVAELARVIAGRVGADAAQATHAASLAKCDLLTRMVGEFPELQGIMGRTYALAQGEPADVAHALDEVYMPRQAGDGIAPSPLGRVLAVAERVDTLAGIFAVGGKPSGSKDPFALRRAALGLARTLIEGGLSLDTRGLLIEALELQPEAALSAGLKPGKGEKQDKSGKDGAAPMPDAGMRRATLTAELELFILDRLRGYYAEQGFAPGLFEAVTAVAPTSLVDFDRRLRALAAFMQRPESASLVAANKRVANLLRKQAEEAGGAAIAINPALFEAPSERALGDALAAARHSSAAAVARHDYAGALEQLAALEAPVARFFDDVMVLADDPAVRANRLALLAGLQAAFGAIADIAQV
jgi:glycyl-tRNA synthetase beta chain